MAPIAAPRHAPSLTNLAQSRADVESQPQQTLERLLRLATRLLNAPIGFLLPGTFGAYQPTNTPGLYRRR